MTSVYVAAELTDAVRREHLYDGDLFVLDRTAASEALCAHARRMIADAFSPYDPQQAQYHLPVDEWVARFAAVKPAFIHDPATLDLIRDVLIAAGCDADDTYMDVPRLRGVTSHGYLTSGVGYAHHPHRDTWYSAPMCQLNWWLPLYNFAGESSMAFHPDYFSKGVVNGSPAFNYYEWNAHQRKDAAKHITTDTRPQPKAHEPINLDPQIRIVCQPAGAIVFSAAQLHSTVANSTGLTRFSLDFRTVSLSDLDLGRSAPNVDSAPTGTSLRDFVRCSDRSLVAEAIIARYDVGSRPGDGVLRYEPERSAG